MTRYRFTYRGKPAAPWRSTRREAQDDAIKAGEATRDEHVPDRVLLRPFAEIEWADGKNERKGQE